MNKVLNEEYVKQLFEKRKYFSEHPEEAMEEYAKRDDGVNVVFVEPKKQDKKE